MADSWMSYITNTVPEGTYIKNTILMVGSWIGDSNIRRVLTKASFLSEVSL